MKNKRNLYLLLFFIAGIILVLVMLNPFSKPPEPFRDYKVKPSPFVKAADGETAFRMLPSPDNPRVFPISQDFGMKIEENPLPTFDDKDLKQIQDHPDWFDFAKSSHSPHRDERFQPFRMMTLMGLKPGDAIADIGTGTGYFAFRFSQVVGENGRVYAVDMDQRVLKLMDIMIRKNRKNKFFKYDNIELVQNNRDGINLPEDCLDYAFLGWTGIYGHMNYHFEGDQKRDYKPDEVIPFFYRKTKNFTQSIYKSLKKNGRLIVIDERKGQNPSMSNWDEGTVEIMEKHGFVLEKRYDYMETLYFLIFRKQDVEGVSTDKQE